jgi:hypothetical protein
VRRRWSEAESPERYRIDFDAFFSGTRFRRGPTIRVGAVRAIAPADLIDQLLSMSSSSPERIGTASETMAAGVGGILAAFERKGATEKSGEAQAETFRSAQIA